jgi:hypothetical protein
MNQSELEILQILDELVGPESVRATLDAVVARVDRKLARDPCALMAWEAVPLSTYGDGLPDAIRSSWVFVLRAGATTGAERHPNSHQRAMAYRGSGDLQTRTGGTWRPNHLVSDPDAPLVSRWVSIPPNTWHQGVVPDANWAVVSFQTVPEADLIEERPDRGNRDVTRRRRYTEVGDDERGTAP